MTDVDKLVKVTSNQDEMALQLRYLTMKMI